MKQQWQRNQQQWNQNRSNWRDHQEGIAWSNRNNAKSSSDGDGAIGAVVLAILGLLAL